MSVIKRTLWSELTISNLSKAGLFLSNCHQYKQLAILGDSTVGLNKSTGRYAARLQIDMDTHTHTTTLTPTRKEERWSITNSNNP